jgi:hypothetical protein
MGDVISFKTKKKIKAQPLGVRIEKAANRVNSKVRQGLDDVQFLMLDLTRSDAMTDQIARRLVSVTATLLEAEDAGCAIVGIGENERQRRAKRSK